MAQLAHISIKTGSNDSFEKGKLDTQPAQLSTFTIRTSMHTTKNCKRACLFSTAFLPTLKTNFFGNCSASSIERIDVRKILIIN
jgi:hypothetical protein